ncbi:MAG: FAD-binding oxidoreductase [Candidatus Methylomirabilis oxyfera]|nr:FAD-binding oxidoreductase [Candidatus Methylomirabilis oxyfera]
MARGTEIVIIGGGIVGLSIAYHLAARGCHNVCVLERGQIGQGATAKATGGIRQQFSREINIRLSQESLKPFERFEEEMGCSADFRQVGYLFLASSGEDWAWLKEAAALQQRLQVPVELLTPEEARRLVPGLWIDDLLGATFCGSDGIADPHAVLHGLAGQARRLGVRILEGREVTGILCDGGRVRGVRMKDGEAVAAALVVNAAGIHAREVGLMAGVEIPVEPHHRQAFVAEPLAELADSMPMTVDLRSGTYVHVERNGNIILGGGDHGDRRGFDERLDWSLLPRLIEGVTHRLPALELARIQRGWAGLREMTPDELAIVGPVPDTEGLFVAAGFSGHGFMHAPAIGKLVAELILDGKASTIDISSLSLDRFRTGQLVPERAVF